MPTLIPRGSNARRSSYFSAARARRGTMYIAFPPFRTCLRTAKYATRDFPLAVGIARTRDLPSRAIGIARSCGGYRSSMPCSVRMAVMRGSTPRSATFIPSSIWRRRHKGLAGVAELPLRRPSRSITVRSAVRKVADVLCHDRQISPGLRKPRDEHVDPSGKAAPPEHRPSEGCRDARVSNSEILKHGGSVEGREVGFRIARASQVLGNDHARDEGSLAVPDESFQEPLRSFVAPSDIAEEGGVEHDRHSPFLRGFPRMRRSIRFRSASAPFR